jgi:hypothetical protein
MVNLLEKSNVDPKTNPIAYQWDSLVRKNFSKYQNIIDAKTYQAQRTQRLLFVHFILKIVMELSKRIQL